MVDQGQAQVPQQQQSMRPRESGMHVLNGNPCIPNYIHHLRGTVHSQGAIQVPQIVMDNWRHAQAPEVRYYIEEPQQVVDYADDIFATLFQEEAAWELKMNAEYAAGRLGNGHGRG